MNDFLVEAEIPMSLHIFSTLHSTKKGCRFFLVNLKYTMNLCMLTGQYDLALSVLNLPP